MNEDFRPEILGMRWTPGDLILVGSCSYAWKTQYVLGNAIVNGTGEDIPVAIFSPRGESQNIMRTLMKMQLGDECFDNGQFSAKDLVDYPVYIDDTFHLTIAYLVERIFHFVEDKGIGMVVIDCLQDIDGSILDTHSKERELNSVLRILKALAESMDLVIVVTSRLSERFFNSNERPSVRDIQDVSEAEKHCDQIVFIHPVGTSLKNYKMILPLGSPYLDEPKDELVLNVTFDRNKHCFSKATGPFEEEEDFQADSPMYQWTEGKAEGEWNFEFIDADGMGWTLNLEPLILEEEEHEYYQISVYNWAGKGVIFDDYVDMDDIELIKAIALEKARQQFPEVEIQEFIRSDQFPHRHRRPFLVRDFKADAVLEDGRHHTLCLQQLDTELFPARYYRCEIVWDIVRQYAKDNPGFSINLRGEKL